MWIIHRVLRAGYRIGYQTGVLSTPFGRSAYEFLYERFKSHTESAAINQLCACITPGSLAIDVGANIGVYTEVLRRHVRDGGRVLAIEPDPSNARSLRRRFADTPAVIIVEAAASDVSGTAHLNQDLYNPAGHVLSDRGLAVRSATIDGLVAEIGLPVSVVKIDVEGAEPLVLKGAAQTLAIHRPSILLEYSPERIAAFDADPRALLEDFEAFDYEFRLPPEASPLTIEQVERAAQVRGYVDVLISQHDTRLRSHDG